MAGLAAAASAVAAPTYHVVVVQPPAPYTAIGVRAVNDAGHFAGSVSDGQKVDFVYWSPETGAMVLSSPAGTILGIGAMDDLENVAINTTAGPYLWSPAGGWRAIERYPGLVSSLITSLNDRGQMVGFGFDGNGERTDDTRRTLAWSSDGHVRLVKAQTISVAAAINEHEDVLSTAFEFRAGALQYEAVLVPHHGKAVPLGDLDGPENGIQSTGVGISENGFAAVNSTDPDLFQGVACYWSAADGLRSLGLGPSSALGMSRRGTMVGTVTETVDHPFYSFAWNQRWGTINLVEHLAAGSPAFDVLYATGISGNGTIGASGFQGSTQSAVVLIPGKMEREADRT
jgi:hypothetical protein